MTFSKAAYNAAITRGLAQAILDRMEFPGKSLDEESVQTAISGVLSGATDEQQADVYSRIVDEVNRTSPSGCSNFLPIIQDALDANRLFD